MSSLLGPDLCESHGDQLQAVWRFALSAAWNRNQSVRLGEDGNLGAPAGTATRGIGTARGTSKGASSKRPVKDGAKGATEVREAAGAIFADN